MSVYLSVTHILGTLSLLVVDADAGDNRVNHAVVNIAKLLSTHTHTKRYNSLSRSI